MSIQDVIPGGNVTIQVAGESIEVSRIKIKHLPLALDLLSVVIGRQEIHYADLLKQGLEPATKLISALIDKPESWVEELDPAEFLAVLKVVIETNASFFIQSVIPMATQMLASMTQVISGRAPSADS